MGIDSLERTDLFALFLEMLVFIRMGAERLILMLLYMRLLTGAGLRK